MFSSSKRCIYRSAAALITNDTGLALKSLDSALFFRRIEALCLIIIPACLENKIVQSLRVMSTSLLFCN